MSHHKSASFIKIDQVILNTCGYEIRTNQRTFANRTSEVFCVLYVHTSLKKTKFFTIETHKGDFTKFIYRISSLKFYFTNSLTYRHSLLLFLLKCVINMPLTYICTLCLVPRSLVQFEICGVKPQHHPLLLSLKININKFTVNKFHSY